MKRSLVAVTAAAMLACMQAHAQEDGKVLTPGQLEERAAQFVLFVPPEFPKAAAAGRGAIVDVSRSPGARRDGAD